MSMKIFEVFNDTYIYCIIPDIPIHKPHFQY